MAKIVLDKEKCIGCGACQAVCPKYFELAEDNKSQVKKEEIDQADINCLEDAVNGCPVQAISLEK